MKKLILLLAGLLAWRAGAQFQPGNLTVLRYGNGMENILDASVKSGISLWLDQYNTGGALLNSLPIPTNGPNALTLNGQTFNTEGMLNRSADRTTLQFFAYHAALGSYPATLAGSTAAQAPRTVGTVDAGANLSLVSLGTNYGGLGPRGAASDDGTNNFWTVGSNEGLLWFNPPVTGASQIPVEVAIGAARNIRIFNGNLYYSVEPGVAPNPITAGIYYFQGLPTGVGFTTIFIATGQESDPADFSIDPTGTIAYVADATNGILRFTNNAGVWYQGATITVPAMAGAGSAGTFGLTADYSGPSAVIYATTVEGTGGNFNGNRLVRIVDSNSAPAVVTLATAASSQAFRGLDFTPDLRPLITAGPQSLNVASGATVTFQVTAASAFSAGYQWQVNGTNLTNQTAASLSLSAVTTNLSGNSYRVVVTNQFGSVTSAPAVLTVSSVKPAITTQPASRTNFLGAAAGFTVAATGTTPMTFQWHAISGGLTNALASGGDYVITSGDTNSVLNISPATAADAGGYFVVITNAIGSATSAVAQLTLVPMPPGINAQPTATTALENGTTSFTISATGTDTPDNPLVYQWYYVANHLTNALADDGEISGSGSATLNLNPVQLTDDGSYFVMISNSAGVTNSKLASLTVLAPPPPSFIPYASAGAVYQQNFDSLPNPGTASVNAANPVTISGVTYSLANPFDFAFPVLASGFVSGLGLSNAMPGWYGASVLATKFGAMDGSLTTGGQISLGKNNDSNRALGLLATGTTGVTSFGAKLVNQTGATLDHINVGFTGELWRQTGGAKTLNFSYWLDATGTNVFSPANQTGTIPALMVSFTAVAPPVNVDGTLAGNQKSLSVANYAIPNWTPGGALWLAWQISSAGSGGQGVAIDDLTFSATSGVVIPAPPLMIKSTGTNAIVSWSATFTGYALYQKTSLTNAVAWSLVSQGAVVNSGFNQVTVPASGGQQYFRLQKSTP